MNKKAIIFSILLTTILFTGCGSNNTTTDKNDTTMLTEKEAKTIVLEKVPGATEDNIVVFRKDSDNSRAEYEGEIHYNGMEYEFEMNAYDGTILDWDEESIKEMAR